MRTLAVQKYECFQKIERHCGAVERAWALETALGKLLNFSVPRFHFFICKMRRTALAPLHRVIVRLQYDKIRKEPNTVPGI